MTTKEETDPSELLRQQTVLARFGELALRSDDLNEILTEACRLVGEALGTDLAKVMELQPDGKTLLVRAGVGWKPGVVGHVTIQASDATSEGHALKTGQAMISPNIATETRFTYPDFLLEDGVKAVANVVITGCRGEPPYGVLQIDSREPRQFADSDTVFLTTYANLISAAVGRMQTTRDLLDREGRLRRSEERLRRIAEIETVGVIFFDIEGRIIDGNEAFLRMSGFTRDDMEAGELRWDRLTPPEWMAESLRNLDELKATGQGRPFEKQYLRKDGSRWWGLFAGRMLDDGTAVELVLDITDRKGAEQALLESETRLRSLIEGIPQLVFRSRKVGKWIWSSSQWTAYTGLSEEESISAGWLNAVHREDREPVMAGWRDAEARGLFSVEHRTFRVADGTYRWFQSRAIPMRDERGRIIEWFGTSTDIDDQVRARHVLSRSREELEAQITERTTDLRRALDSLQAEMLQRERAEKALLHAQKMEAVGQLTGGIAHDFNNMLQGISGSLELAEMRAAQGRTVEVLRFLAPARRTVDRAAGLTRRLLAFARRQRLQPKPIDPGELVTGMADLIGRTMGPAVRLKLCLRDSRARVVCDPSELESALLNLCINARDAMADGGQLMVATDDVHLSAADVVGQEAAQPGAFIAISVTDTGCGMPPNVLEHVFEPFFTTKPIGQGTGLGLSQVYGFVQQSGGLVRVESAPGKGTTVRLYLPQRQQPSAADRLPVAPAPDEARPGQTVLVVDDEDIVREAVAERLRELGYHVLEASDGPSALRLMNATGHIDMLVTDVGLPNGMNGRQLAETMRAQRPGLPLLFITGYAGTDLPPGSEVIDKPFNLDIVARKVQAVMAQS